MIEISGSIVLYKNNIKILKEAIKSFLSSDLRVKLYLIDNSPDDSLKILKDNPHIEYIFNNKNLGFGKAHNIALRKSLEDGIKYHLVLNPDVYFNNGVLPKLYSYMEENLTTGLVMPKVLYPDGNVQYLCKLIPTPADLIFRRFFKFKKAELEKRNFFYEMKFTGYDKVMEVPYLSGCFMFLRTEALRKVGVFDERIFMYTEDADLTRRIYQKYSTVFYPEVSIYHHFEKGSHKSLKLLFYAIHGNMVYFFKWGWCFDKERKEINKSIIEKYHKETV